MCGEERGMKNTEHFALCERVRYCDDFPAGGRPPGERSVFDYIARIRSHGLLVTARTSPNIQRAIDRVSSALLLEESPEVYIINDPLANAHAPAMPAQSRPVVVLHSGLFSLLSLKEVEFAIGHELGHFGCGHRRTAEQKSTTHVAALRALAAERAAEVTADRLGLIAVGSMFTAARVMVKMACGLRGDDISLDVDGFLAQLERSPEEMSREWELYESHPALPLRLWALLRFGESDSYITVTGAGDGGLPLAGVDAAIRARFGESGDGRLARIEEREQGVHVVWAALAAATEDGVVTSVERDALRRTVGEELAAQGLTYVKEHGREAVQEKFLAALGTISQLAPSARASFVERFCSFCELAGRELSSLRAWKRVRACKPSE